MSPLLVTQSLSHHAQGREIFTDLEISIHEGDRAALIGPNGAGKSTLLRLFAREIEPDAGTITIRRDTKFAFVPQLENFKAEDTVLSVLEQAISEDQSGSSLSAIPKWLGKGKFPDRNLKANSLSGGWKKRLSLICGFVKEPDLLLLDEPTNHLDIDGIEWLENLLQNFNQTFIVVSHDRYFLESICKKVIEVDNRYPNGVFAVDGTYTEFVEKRADFFEARAQYQDSLANKVRRETAWLRAGVKARTTKSKYRQEQAYKLTDELKGIKLDRDKIDISYSESNRKTKDLIETENLSKSIGEKTLFKNLSFVLKSGMRAGIVGLNGCGKTTLINTLLGKIKPDSGKLKIAKNLNVAVFEQDRSSLDKSITLKTALCPYGDSVVFNGQSMHIIAWAKRFLFRADQLTQLVSTLSGGEQARILIARAMCKTADVLIMDEPTNDLDIATLEMLEDSLLEFKGAVIIISHDRAFLDRVATHVIGFLGNGKVELYADYHQWDDEREEIAIPASNSVNGEKLITTEIKLSKEERKELSQLEKHIEKTEKKITDLQLKLSDASMDKDFKKISELSEIIKSEQDNLSKFLERWEKLEERR